MTLNEIKDALKDKAMELEEAIESGKPHEELVGIYKEMKELQYLFLQREIKDREVA
jgi:hypothetical protein